MQQKKIDDEYRQEIFKDKNGYSNLYEIELKKNKWRFENGS